jgi:hypothetical protein
MEIPEEEKIQVKATWRLAWGLWWKMFLIGLGISAVINVVLYYTVLKALIAPLLGLFGAFGG